jgi:hypothetical protein
MQSLEAQRLFETCDDNGDSKGVKLGIERRDVIGEIADSLPCFGRYFTHVTNRFSD